METTMYDTLLQLPLFQGLGKNDLTNILAKVKFHFQKYEAGATIVEQGAPCKELFFILNGDVKAITTDDHRGFSVEEAFRSPYVIEPFSLFGMHTRYVASYEAETAVDAISIDKSFVVDELNHYEIFRFNFLNIISNRAQVAYEKLRNCYIGGIRERLVDFIAMHMLTDSGQKCLKIKMETLAELIDESRLNVSHELNALQREGLLRLGRKEIVVPELRTLTESLTLTQKP
jgi:CRP-like cAMP-binding protein